MLTSPDNNAPVDAALQKSKNAVTLNYAEAERLKELADSQQYKLVELGKQIVESNNLLADSAIKIEKNNIKIRESNDEVDSLLLKISELKKQDSDLTAQIKVKTDEFQARESILVSNEVQFQGAVDRLNKKDSDLLKREEAVVQREQKIKQFIQTL